MSIASLGIAIAYLLLIIASAVGALLLLVWLFGEGPGVTETGRGTAKGTSQSANFEAQSTSSTWAETEASGDRAA